MTSAAAPSRYQVLDRIAAGGMGEILLARRAGPAGFEKLVVLKRALAASAGSPSVIAALIDEARLLAQINHANVCQIHDLEHADGEYVLVLEYLEGMSLWSILSESEEAQRTIEARVVCGLIEPGPSRSMPAMIGIILAMAGTTCESSTGNASNTWR